MTGKPRRKDLSTARRSPVRWPRDQAPVARTREPRRGPWERRGVSASHPPRAVRHI